MKKLNFLVGNWSGEAHVFLSETGPKELAMAERAEYKLDGLVLTIEGTGRNKTNGDPALQAFGVVSYDDASGTYHMRAFNDGRRLETDIKLADEGRTSPGDLRWEDIELIPRCALRKRMNGPSTTRFRSGHRLPNRSWT